MSKIQVKQPSKEMIDAMKPFIYEMYPWVKRMDELEQKVNEQENIIHLLRRLVEDWLNQISMNITFREKFYQIVGEPYPDWFEIPEPGLHHRQWVENNSLGEKVME